jgi:16S rRNA (uracil1498-N3)-methyltransferase
MELFYCPPQNISGDSLLPDEFETKHIVGTLRKKIGDSLHLTDGLGLHFTGRIRTLKPRVIIEVEKSDFVEADAQKIALGIGFIKTDRLETALEKCTELGVNTFYIFRSEYANYFSNNLDKFTKILRQAIKQSNRFYLPDIHLCSTFKDFLSKTSSIQIKIAAIDPNCPPLSSIIPFPLNTSKIMTIGPEGGFSAAEVQQLNEMDFKSVSLGAYRLRAETAAIAGISRLIL